MEKDDSGVLRSVLPFAQSMLLEESAFFFLSVFSLMQCWVSEDGDHLDGTFSSSVIQKKRLGDPLWLASVDVFLARRE